MASAISLDCLKLFVGYLDEFEAWFRGQLEHTSRLLASNEHKRAQHKAW